MALAVAAALLPARSQGAPAVLAGLEEDYERLKSPPRPDDLGACAVAWPEFTRTPFYREHRHELVAALLCPKDLSACDGPDGPRLAEFCEEARYFLCLDSIRSHSPDRNACRQYLAQISSNVGQDDKYDRAAFGRDAPLFERSVALLEAAVTRADTAYCREFSLPAYRQECRRRLSFARGPAGCRKIGEACVRHVCLGAAAAMAASGDPSRCGGDAYCAALFGDPAVCAAESLSSPGQLLRRFCADPGARVTAAACRFLSLAAEARGKLKGLAGSSAGLRRIDEMSASVGPLCVPAASPHAH